MSGESTFAGVACNGDGCTETFTIIESNQSNSTDPSNTNCGSRCK